MRTGDFNMRHSPETAAIVEPGKMGVTIKAVAFDPALDRHVASPRNDPARVSRNRDARHRADSQGFA